MSPWDAITKDGRRQDGAVSREQLLAAGLYSRHIAAACHDGRLQRAFRGAYVLGSGPPSRHCRIWAAYLSAGDGVFVYHATALEVHELPVEPDPRIHLGCATRRRTRGVIRMHEAPRTRPEHLWRKRGMTVAMPGLALLGVAVDLAPEPLAVLVANAVATRKTSVHQLGQVLDAYPRHHGRPRLAAAVDAELRDPGEGRTHGQLEAKALPLIRALPGLPAYVRNERFELADGQVVVPDLWFPGPRVWLELDSRTWHERRKTMDADRRKDQRAAALGIVVFRITWQQLLHEWEAVSADLLTVLGRDPT